MANRFQRIVQKLVGASEGGVSWRSVWNPSVEEGTDPADIVNFFMGYPHAAITAISDEVSKADFYVVEIVKKTGVETEKPDHPFIRLLNNPNPMHSGFSLLEASDTNYSFFGEFFWFVSRGEATGMPVELWPINPLNMTEIVDNETGELKGWKFRGYQGADQALRPDEVIHIKNYNPRNPYRGWGVMQAAINQVLVEKHGMEFTKNFLRNNAFPGGVYNIKKDISKELFAKFKDQLRASYSGTGNAGKLMVLKNADGEFQKLGSNLQEVAIKDLKDVTTESILNMFRLPKQILGIPDNINLATSKVLETTYQKRTIKPRLDRIVNGLQPTLAEYEASINRLRKNKIRYELRYRNIVPEDADEKMKQVESGLTHGYITPNEARDHSPMVLDPIDTPAANLVYTDPSRIPLGTPAPQAKTRKVGNVHIKKVKPTQKVTSHPEVSLDDFNEYRRSKWDDLNSAGAEAEAFLTDYWNKQMKSVIRNVKAKAIREKLYEGILFDVNEESARLKAGLEPLFTDVAKDQFKIAEEFAQTATKAYNDYADQLDEFIVYRLDAFVTSSLTGVRDDVANVLTEATKEGLTAAETARKIEDVYGSISSKKTMVIARTELNAIANRSAAAAFVDQGFTYKQWFANPGACQYCRSMDGRVVSIEKNFVNVGETIVGTDGGQLLNNHLDISEPPAHTNCKCDLIPANEAQTPFGTLPPLSEREELADIV